MNKRILASAAVQVFMLATVSTAAPRSVTHEEASDQGRCSVGTYDIGTNLCIIAGPATAQTNAYQTTNDGLSHYEASQDNMKCFVGAYDIATGQCIVPGKGQSVSVSAAPESLGGTNASGNSVHNFN